MWDEVLLSKLARLRQELAAARGEREEIREALAAHGSFFRIENNSRKGDIVGRGAVAVDGSCAGTGQFPGCITILRALAAYAGERRREERELYRYDLLAGIGEEGMSEEEDKDRAEEEYRAREKKLLAALEVEAALMALRRWEPALVIFDGGFLRLANGAGDRWEELVQVAREKGVALVGVIEEIGTYDLSRKLKVRGKRPAYHDRELFYGLLEMGEGFLLRESIKGGFRTVFVRFSSYPQAVACDFLPEVTDEEIFRILAFLASITPRQGRGIPLLLDVVDSRVRISREELESILYSRLGPELVEKYFLPQRQRRPY
ncbi:MAG: hypothetical protein PWQ91_359 [Eubacteriales bacterium]|nr:hypothetical protein [Eubacteriales bacterium]MDN5363298.1 hypothetical protein [Eubacteriales bacterium]